MKKLPNRIARAMVSCLCLAFFSKAGVFYVDPQTGAIGNDGTSGSPWGTLKEVVDNGKIGTSVVGGDTLLLRSGNHGRVTISGKKNSETITIMAAPGQHPVLERIRFSSCKRWKLKGVTVTSQRDTPSDNASLISIDGDDATRCFVSVESCTLYTVLDASSWTQDQWNTLPLNGIAIGATGSVVRHNHVKNVNFGIHGDADSSLVEYNTVENFSGDGLRGLGDDMAFEYNTVKNCYAVNENHDDGFQSWSVGADKSVGTGTVYRLTLRGNTVINYEDPNQPFRGTLQGIGCFDGMFEGWIVENNVIVTDHWHGISLYGAKNCRVVNNTVCDVNNTSPGPPWIMITAHKNGTPASGCIVRNNLTTDLAIDAGSGTIEDHNIEMSDPNDFFADYAARDLQLKSGCAAIDAGSSENVPPLDIRGAARPAGEGYDIGAYEFGAVWTAPRSGHALPPPAAARVRVSPVGLVVIEANDAAAWGDVAVFSPSGRRVGSLSLVRGRAVWDRRYRARRALCPGLFMFRIEPAHIVRAVLAQ